MIFEFINTKSYSIFHFWIQYGEFRFNFRILNSYLFSVMNSYYEYISISLCMWIFQSLNIWTSIWIHILMNSYTNSESINMNSYPWTHILMNSYDHFIYNSYDLWIHIWNRGYKGSRSPNSYFSQRPALQDPLSWCSVIMQARHGRCRRRSPRIGHSTPARRLRPGLLRLRRDRDGRGFWLIIFSFEPKSDSQLGA